MVNTRIKGTKYRKLTPKDLKFGGRDFILTFEGNKTDADSIAKNLRSQRHLARVVKTPKGYDFDKNKPYGVYVCLRQWSVGIVERKPWM